MVLLRSFIEWGVSILKKKQHKCNKRNKAKNGEEKYFY